MKTKELIQYAKSSDAMVNIDGISGWTIGEAKKCRDEIAQRLREFDELKKMITDVVDPLIEVYEFLLADLEEDE